MRFRCAAAPLSSQRRPPSAPPPRCPSRVHDLGAHHEECHAPTTRLYGCITSSQLYGVQLRYASDKEARGNNPSRGRGRVVAERKEMGCGSSTAKTSTPGEPARPAHATANSSSPEDIAGHASNSPKPAKYSAVDAAASLEPASDAPARAGGPEHNGSANAPSTPPQQHLAAHRTGAARPSTNNLPPVRGAIGGSPLKSPLTGGLPMLPEVGLSDRSPSPSGRTEKDKESGRRHGHHHKHKHKHHKHKHHDRSRSPRCACSCAGPPLFLQCACE